MKTFHLAILSGDSFLKGTGDMVLTWFECDNQGPCVKIGASCEILAR